ncbi:hypothetical protein [uncultured Rhodoblastus sp.]|uniref:hypothetical protein n=1 Tax=uncultured Rhodoblastus sp. TaxID=543037 RepID=UPI0025F69A20|nr:hypothetical protein [uncultured Rhodoblastus sp.]
MNPKCRHCGLPIRIHLAFCLERGIRFAQMPLEAFRPGAIHVDAGELRWIKPVPPNKIKPDRPA